MGSITDILREKIKLLVEEADLELVDLDFCQGGSRSVLRIFVDKTGGVTLDQCAKLNRKIGDYLDMEDLIAYRYLLEVSSPGLDRPLLLGKDFKRKIGEKVKVFLKEKLDGQNEWVGKIMDFKEEDLILLIEPHKKEAEAGIEKIIPIKNVAWAKIVF
jgi:ribosome maturation factor RimP